jgi:multicomponent Na+:H+ antiporter subunit D
MTMLVALPIVIPLLTAALCLLGGPRARLQRGLARLGAGGLLLAASVLVARVWVNGPLALHVGGWSAPLGITLVADVFAALMVLAAALLHVVVSVYAFADVDSRRVRHGYFAFANVMLMGVCGAFLAGDLFNLYVWFEVMLMSSFVLLVLGGGRAQMEAGIKYVALSLLSSALFLAGIGVIYGLAHPRNMAHLSAPLAVAAASHPGRVPSAALLLLLAFGIKAAGVPLHFWVPDSYPAPPPAVTALFAALLTKTGVYALVRVFTLVLPPSDYLFQLLAVVAGLTMLVGVLGAVAQAQVRRILSVHIVSQIGYMVLGVALLGSADATVRHLAIAAAIFYIIHNMLVKTNLLLLSGTIRSLTGTEQLSRLGGLLNRAPLVAVLFLVSAFSLAGLPPSSGFWAKLGIIKAGFDAQAYLLTGTALFVGLLTLLSMIKIWSEAFWKAEPTPPSGGAQEPQPAAEAAPARKQGLLRLGPSVVLVIVSVAIGLYPQPLLATARRAAEQLLDRPAYVAAVGIPTDGWAPPAADLEPER